jgi:glycosyltransferase involved in cell wall biosynthesis
MKILLSADYFYPAPVGGPSSTIYWQAKTLTQAGHEVSVVATSQALPVSIPRDQWLTMDCGRVVYTRNPHFYAPIKHIWQGWRAMRKSDIVHINSIFYPASFIWVLMSRLIGKPVIWSPHGELSPVALWFSPHRKRLISKLIRWVNPVVWFHATSVQEGNDIRRHLGDATRVIEIQNRMEMPNIVRPTPVTPPYLLFIGRIHPIKAIDNLLLALGASSLFQESNCSLQIVGPEIDKAYARRIAKMVQALNLSGKVMFAGSVQGDQKQHVYANARLTILPSHAESFGNVVIESLAQGTPVLASTNTPWQILETERVGSWVSNEPDQLRQSIETYLTMPDSTYKGYRERAVRLAHEQFSIREGADEWTQLYERIIGKSAADYSLEITANQPDENS